LRLKTSKKYGRKFRNLKEVRILAIYRFSLTV